MKTNLAKKLNFAHGGLHVESYGPGVCEVPEDVEVWLKAHPEYVVKKKAKSVD